MDTETLVDVLQDAGLPPYQSRAYVTLLGLGTVSAQRLAAESDVPRPRIYDVLESLEAAGYVVTDERDQLYVTAVEPDRGLAGLETRIEEFQRAVAEIESRWIPSDTGPGDISVFKQFRTIRERTRDRIETAERRVVLALSYAQFVDLKPTIRAAYQRGVSVLVGLHGDDEERLSTESFEGVCTEVRGGDGPCLYEPFLAIVDDESVTFAPFARPPPAGSDATARADPTPEYGLVIDDEIQAYVFEWYFLSALWEPSTTVYTERSGDPPYTFVEIREFIVEVEPLLREGMEVMATVEGRSVRTGRSRTVAGQVDGVRSDHSASPDGNATPSILTRRATVVLETDDGPVTVGGRGSTLEDVEASRILLTEIRSKTSGEPSSGPLD
jgi:sugar-specific transcriptional regulator TrmB